jgi:hypothetical protein
MSTKRKLTRISNSYLTTGMIHPTIYDAGPAHPCGGELMVQDWKICASGRYELFCQKCKACDPNGYDTQAEVVTKGYEYFDAQPQS